MTVPPPPGRDTPRRRRARERLAALLWDEAGARRLPRERELAAALAAAGDDAWWVCEASSAGPVYLLPTREWIGALARTLRALGARTVVEIAAGDGFLARALAPRLRGVRVIATDSGRWARAAARMSAADRREHAGVPFAGLAPGANVLRLAASAAVARWRPDVVLCAWAPPGSLVERAIRGPCRFVLDVSVDGDVCGDVERTWRFRKDFLEGPVRDRALCRLDARGRRTVVTLYYGKRHPLHGLE